MRALGAIAILAAVLAAPGSAAGKAACDVYVIHARRAVVHVDPALGPLKADLTSSFSGPGYNSFDLLSHSSFALDAGQAGSFDIPNGTKGTVTFKKVSDGFLRIYFKVTDPAKAGDIEVKASVKPGGHFYYAGRTWKGGILVFAIFGKLAE